MANNPNLPALSKQFGFGAPQGADPAAAGRKSSNSEYWDIRDAMRRLMEMPYDPEQPPTRAQLLGLLAPNRKPRNSELVAVSRFMLACAMDEHSEKSIAALVEDVCGKLPNVGVNTHLTLNGQGLAALLDAANKRVEAARQREKEKARATDD